MRLRNQIVSVLKSDRGFFPNASDNLQEPVRNLKNACSLIINALATAIQIQCVINDRKEEICMIAKECSLLNLQSNPFSNLLFTNKGSLANSELFGDRFSVVVEILSQQSGLKKSSLKKLFSVLTPLVLSNIYFNYKAQNLSIHQLDAFIKKICSGSKISREMKLELQKLIRNEERKNMVQHSGRSYASQFFAGRLFQRVWVKLARTKVSEIN